jgi:hypothetical protein
VLKPQLGHQSDIGLKAVKVVAGHQAIAGVFDALGLGTKLIPNAGYAAPFSSCAFDLKRRGRASPFKAIMGEGWGDFEHEKIPGVRPVVCHISALKASKSLQKNQSSHSLSSSSYYIATT